MTLFCIFFLPITQIKVTSKLIHYKKGLNNIHDCVIIKDRNF